MNFRGPTRNNDTTEQPAELRAAPAGEKRSKQSNRTSKMHLSGHAIACELKSAAARIDRGPSPRPVESASRKTQSGQVQRTIYPYLRPDRSQFVIRLKNFEPSLMRVIEPEAHLSERPARPRWVRLVQVFALATLAPICAEYLSAYDSSTGDPLVLLQGLVILAP